MASRGIFSRVERQLDVIILKIRKVIDNGPKNAVSPKTWDLRKKMTSTRKCTFPLSVKMLLPVRSYLFTLYYVLKWCYRLGPLC